MSQSELLYHLWYVAAHGSEVSRGKTVTRHLLGHSVLIGRDSEGKVFAMRDFCPHRGIPLSYGSFDGQTIECCYHGWCFNTKGACTAIPSLPPGDTTDLSRIKAFSFPCREENGIIWVYVPPPGTRLPEHIPELAPAPEPLDYMLVESIEFPCNIDHAVIGLMDPSHGPFVHRSWWWRTKKSIHLKTKKFAPVGLGFRMVGHAPSSNSRAYKILGGKPVTEITFQLPGLRTEHIRIGDKRHILLLTALTPLDGERTQLHQYIATNIGWVKKLLPLLKPFGKAFIKQDYDIVIKQQEGLRSSNQALMLLGDADQQALWYYKLRKDFLAAQEQGVAFENRVPEKTLTWQS